jgi:hypothetical protein
MRITPRITLDRSIVSHIEHGNTQMLFNLCGLPAFLTGPQTMLLIPPHAVQIVQNRSGALAN